MKIDLQGKITLILAILCITCMGLCIPCIGLAQHTCLNKSIAQVNAVGNEGFGHEAAMAAWQQLGTADVAQAPTILANINADKPLAANWLRAAVDQIVERHVNSGKALPKSEFEKIVFDQAYAPIARRMAYEWLQQCDSTAAARIIPKMLNDSSLEMRRDAVALAIKHAQQLEKGPEAIKQYRVALTAARDFDQIESIHKTLTQFGEKVELQQHFGFLINWKLVGPFDNTDKDGFDVAYGPEQDLASKNSYTGKSGEVRWSEHTTTDEYGTVNLNEAVGKHMGAVTYAYTEFPADRQQEVDLRLVSKNATKIWLNGEVVMSNEVYHTGSSFDQYIGHVTMKLGKNSILVKVCQNEQTEAWAQEWQFQLRVCDKLGTAVLAAVLAAK